MKYEMAETVSVRKRFLPKLRVGERRSELSNAGCVGRVAVAKDRFKCHVESDHIFRFARMNSRAFL